MGKFIVATFLLLGLAFYELSGGADFVPESRPVAVAEPTTSLPSDAAISVQATGSEAPQVTRAALALPVAVTPVAPAADPAPVTDADVIAALQEALPPDGAAAVAEPVSIVAAQEPAFTSLAAAGDIREVAGSRVNMRAGPGTDYDVLDVLDIGTQAEVIEVDSEGWARLRVIETGQIGWMAERLLTDG